MRSTGNSGKPMSTEKAIERLQALCARQEKCAFDVIQKLKQWKIDAPSIQIIVTKLKRDGYVNDSRYAALFVKEKSSINKWGPEKIRVMLAHKGIAKSIIEEVLTQIDTKEAKDQLLELLKRKLPTIKAKSTYDLKNKLIRFGVSRGFNLNAVIEQANKLIQTNDD